MDKYIGFKLIEAEPENKMVPINKNGHDYVTSKEGYKVKYPDGYISWSPKEVFEKAYLKVTPNPKLKSNVSISQDMVDSFIRDVKVSTIGDKTTLVRVTLVNGFELVESSACVDKENYDKKIGSEICLTKIKDKIWYLLGFLLQTAVGGIK